MFRIDIVSAQGWHEGVTDMYGNYSPGDLVRHPDRPEWGVGQVQSAVGSRVTVNFRHAGKHLVNTSEIRLLPVADSDTESPLTAGRAKPRP